MKTKRGVALWDKAKKIIPGGTQLLSKRSELFLPEQWPSYYEKAKGVELWDLDGNKFTDMSYMGIGACTLGYADEDVNRAVKDAIDKGSASTLNCPEDVELAELLLKLHSWGDMVRYARTGGEAMAVAVRIARAYSGKDTVAFCGYHGWHDWYLSTNIADNRNLNGHHISGLTPLGVPRCLKGTALPFHYNKIEELEAILEKNEIGAIVMEPVRHHMPENDFLRKVRKLADENNAVLIFDEVTSGWRMRVGGVHEDFKVYPDIVVYGKAISNGFPMAAIMGRGEVMNKAQDSFISSTNWTERIGPVAAIATINKMKEHNVPARLNKTGEAIFDGWKKRAEEDNIEIETEGIAPLATFNFKYGDENQTLNTLFTQEMLERGFLATKSVYVSYSHTEEHVEKYLDAAGEVFKLISESLKEKKHPKLLKGPVAQTGFKRLT